MRTVFTCISNTTALPTTSSVPLERSWGDLSADGFFRQPNVSVLEIVAFEKGSHPDDSDTSGFYGRP